MPVAPPASALTSTSLERAPAPLQSFVRGKSGHVPFWPGGFDDVLLPQSDADADPTKLKGLRRVPPGFSRGLNFGDDVDDVDDIDDDVKGRGYDDRRARANIDTSDGIIEESYILTYEIYNDQRKK